MILRSAAVVVLLGAAVAAFAACGGGDERRRADSPSRPELEWVEAYADWERRLIRDVRLADARFLADPDSEHLAFAVECAADLRDDVGRPPTRRLERPWRLAAEACTFLRAWRENQIDLAGEDDPGEELFEAAGNLERWGVQLELAEQALLELVGDDRPLPVRRRPSPESHVAPPYGRVATILAHREVRARCWSEDDWEEVVRVVSALDPEHYVDYAGLAAPGDGRISLAPEVCIDLALLAYTDRRPDDPDALREVAAAVLTLAHEAVHVRAQGGVEAEVECYALQEVRRTAQALGATPAYADRLAEVAWEDVYPENAPEYVTEDCRDGGPLDVRPADSAWP